ncbi:hypothetical protein [Ornithinimicrobium flavum]|uniref:hypothetical protein n=1 Tax=Ornithinimicrobium flavum TaxID=1288636 RepID=UPI00107022F9|nr:hypothetical protein [Ornithinimicrobium flavum]
MTGAIVGVLVAALIATGVLARDYFSEVRTDAREAVKALTAGDLTAAGHLAAYRGQPDFAHLFASQLTPREIGDALGTVAGDSADAPFRPGFDTHGYELALTDLAGTLALATHGQDELALPDAWTADFITATTIPQELYGEGGWFFDAEGRQRERTDLANKANLLLVLSRGYWSTEFLQSVTRSYYEHDLREGRDAWPEARPRKDVPFAPAPNGVYLTDGILALTAALTANQAAAGWAFTDFLPGTTRIDQTEHHIGRFTHYLLFEHRFPETPDGDSVGVTATLTALSAAVDAASWASDPAVAILAPEVATDVGPWHDATVLQALAAEVIEESGCSWDPRDYWTCTKAVAGDLASWVQRWGHVVLAVLALPISSSPHLRSVRLGAIMTNATWYAVEGDYRKAGLTLAGVRPDLPFRKIVSAVKAGDAAEKAARQAAHVAEMVREIRAGAQGG